MGMRLAGAFLLLTVAAAPAGPVKVACVGDSITFGVGATDRARNSYPAVLGALLGPGYRVKNFGYSGAALLAKSRSSYRKTAAFREAIAFEANIVVIALGTNDSKPENWDGREAEFRSDYEAFLARFARKRGSPKIFICLPPPSFQTRGDDIREMILKRERRLLRELAVATHRPLIDLYAPLKDQPAWLPDGVHPNDAGAAVIALAVAHALREK